MLFQFITEYEKVPGNIYEPFIVKFFINENDEKTGDLRWWILLSSQYLIETRLKKYQNWLLSLDHTYKTNAEEAPLLFFGAADEQGHFHGMGAVLSNREDAKSIDPLFQFIHDEALEYPSVIIADGAPSITKSCEKWFPESRRLMCYTHLVRKAFEKLAGVRAEDSEVAGNILHDIRTLAMGVPDEESFIVLYTLLVRKWTEET